jgi:YebC/PmpR family DNA-binding regulatory protein
MSGHSKWAQIKRQKGVADVKRGGLFTKLANVITVAAKLGGADPEMNFKLRIAVDKAKSANMPSDNIERAVKRGAGGTEENMLEEIIYEAYGPGGTAIIIEALTDNKNRTVSVIRKLIEISEGKLGGANSVMWMFEKRGVLRSTKESMEKIKDIDEFQLKAIDAGAEEIILEKNGLIIYTKPEDLQKIKELLIQDSIIFDSSDIELVAKDRIRIEDEATKNKLEKIFIELEGNDEVNNYYTNAEID